ncbi:MAG TPA: DUF1284 domain-containing protein [Lachnospiraceae bacterium]|nr:DUF1284 domain-containing protein [Lachnospiraceae bacterium]
MLSYRLRPHHALCITFFEGKGYSTEFVENMIQVIQGLEDNAFVQLTVEEDAICIACPNNNKQRCTSGDKVMRYDQAVLSLCQLKEGQKIRWKELNELAKERIIRAGKLQTVCGDCQWYAICSTSTSSDS